MGRGFLLDELKFSPQMKILSDEQVARFQEAAFEILERIGMKVTHPKARDYLAGAGCKIEGEMVYYPQSAIKAALAKAPERVVMGTRDLKRTIHLEGRKSYFGPTLDCVNYLNPENGQREPFVSKHLLATARLFERMDYFDWSMTLGMVGDYPAHMSDMVAPRLIFENTTKPLVSCCGPLASLKEIYEMAVLCQGGVTNYERQPLMATMLVPVSPLLFDEQVLEKLIFCAEKKIPLILLSGAQAAGTAPATMAGTVAMGFAEILSGLVLQQAISPGAPFICASFNTLMDMRSTIYSYGAIEMAMMVSAQAQLAQSFSLPFFGTAGCTDSHAVDIQAGVEGALQDIVAAAVGQGLVHDTHCWLDSGMTMAPTHMVMGEEILKMVKRFMEGFVLSDETLALDVLEKVGPGGNFLTEKHTMKHFKSMLYQDLFERNSLESWEKKGSPPIDRRLVEKTQKLLALEPINLLEPEKVKELDARQKSWEKW